MIMLFGQMKKSLRQRMKVIFIELVCFQAENDDVLCRHLNNALRNVQYTSKTIQNELISIIGNNICTEILSEVK